MKLGFIGYGEAAFELSYGLSQEGLKNMVAYDSLLNQDSFSQLVTERAKKANVSLKTSIKEVCLQSDIIIVAVPANKSLELSEKIAPFLSENKIYVDVSAAAPTIKEKINELVSTRNILFVDVAMMGPLPVYKHKVPMLVSGNGAENFINYMKPFHMKIKNVSPNPGDATTVKLIRSVYMKGLCALLFEMLEAARYFKVDSLVVESISETMDKTSFKQTLNRLVTGTYIHAERRAHELEGTVDMLKSNKIDSEMSESAKFKLQNISRYNSVSKQHSDPPTDWEEVIDLLIEQINYAQK